MFTVKATGGIKAFPVGTRNDLMFVGYIQRTDGGGCCNERVQSHDKGFGGETFAWGGG